MTSTEREQSTAERQQHGSNDGRCDCAEGCKVDIKIESQGVVNIFACATTHEPGPGTTGTGDAKTETPSATPIAPGQCIPLAIGSKPKQSQRSKLDTLLATTPVPNTLAAAFFQHARRFSAGKAPANPLEVQVFSLFDALAPDIKSILSCSVEAKASIPPQDQIRLFEPSITQDPDVPLDAATIGAAVAKEATKRVALELFGDPLALDGETPGANRFYDTTGIESFEAQLRICSINGLRTNEFVPAITPGERVPEELQQVCAPILIDGEVHPNCEVQVGNCPGNALDDGTCLRVPDVRNGDAVVLQGVNFITVDARVRLTPTIGSPVEVDGFVVGDTTTPLTELIDGSPVVIRDCRVRDTITFAVPAQLAPGTYGVQVVIPNPGGIAGQSDPILSNFQYIQVLPPQTARFRISSEVINARQETSPALFGSDEVRVVTTAWPYSIGASGIEIGQERIYKSPEFGSMDSHDPEPWKATLFEQVDVMDGLGLLIVGHEIDSDTAYEKQIDSFVEAFLHYGKIVLLAIAVPAGVGALWMGLQPFVALALAHPIILAIVALTALAVTIVLAAWAPADLIISDSMAFTTAELAALTSGDGPMPSPSTHDGQGGIDVVVTPLSMIPTQYRENREYICPAEDSRYEIVFRYNRIA